MIKNNLRIKENITLMDQVNAIEFISEYYFQNGRYTPYYAKTAETIAIATYFITGYILEKDENGNTENLLKLCYEDEDMQNAIETFREDRFVYKNIREFINEQVADKVDFMKNKIIHANPDLDIIVEAANVIIESLANFANMNVELMNPENMQTVIQAAQKLKDSNIPITKEFITQVIRDAAAFDFDNATKEILDGKNEQIKNLSDENKELRKYKMLWDSRNTNK